MKKSKPSEQLSVPVNFRLSPRSYKELEEMAAKHGLRISPFLRMQIYKLLNMHRRLR